MPDLRAPFPYMGGKHTVAGEVWRRLGPCVNYVEPFVGSAAVLLARPDAHRWWDLTETVNDSDGLLANFWRATAADPDAVAEAADWPVSECDLHARHAWLCGHREDITRRLEGDPEWYDARAAGWWVWGACAWIASAWCGTNGPWRVVDGELLPVGGGQIRQRPHLGRGRGINRKIPHLGDGEGLCDAWSEHLRVIFAALRDRLRRVQICCGDWSRVCGPTPMTHTRTPVGVFLDPPYASDERAVGCYAHDDGSVAADAMAWAIEHGDDPRYRIAVCGYEGNHDPPATWIAWRWKAHGGYGHLGDGRGLVNATRETIWFSPHCLGGQLALEWGEAEHGDS